MKKQYGDLFIRDAIVDDAKQLCVWWNDGKVMEHAGFPNGLKITEDEIKQQIEAKQSGGLSNNQRHMIIYKDTPIGEMNYHQIDITTCEIGIKICDFKMQNKGIGKTVLSMLITFLFDELAFQKIILDTDLKNYRAQHVYEELGFKKVRINENAYRDQLGNLHSSIDYELTKDAFSSFL